MLTEAYRTHDAADRRVVRFSNGLTAILAYHGATPTVAIRILVRGGSAFEGPHVGTGVSHVFEHLITCDGAGPYSEAEYMRQSDALGGLNNAYTASDHICYHATVPNALASRAIDLLSYYVVAAHMTRDVFHRELGVVQRELERDRDDPQVQLEELLNELLYEGHPMAAPVIGYRERLISLRHEDLLAFQSLVHAGENMIVVVAGDFDFDTLTADIAKAFTALPRGRRIESRLPDPPALITPRRATRSMAVESASMTFAWPTVRECTSDDAALDLLASILLDGDDARLVKRLRWDDEIVFDIGGLHDSSWHTPGSLQVTAHCDAELIDRVEAALLDELRQLTARPIAPEELARAQRQNLTTILFHRETAEGVAAQLGEDYLAAGDIAYSDEFLQRLQTVTLDDLQRVAQRYLIDKPFVAARIVPTPSSAAAPLRQTNRSSDDVRRFITPGGLTCLTRSMPQSRFVAVAASLIGGLVAERPESNGIFNGLAGLWTRGSRGYSADDLAATFGACGASIRAGSGLNQFSLGFLSLAEDFARLWPLFVDTLLNPTMADDEWDKAKPQILDAIARQNESWHTELVQFARECMFGDSPYRMSRIGTEASISAMSADALRSTFARFASPRNAVLSIVGGVGVNAAMEAIQRDLGEWGGGIDRWRPGAATPMKIDGDRLFVKASSEDREVAGVFVGFPGLSIADRADRAAVTVFDTILAGYALSGGRLFNALRSGDNDLAYEIAGISFSGMLPGFIAYSAGCEPDRANDVYAVMRREIDAIRAGKLDAEDVARAKAMIRTGELDQLQTAPEIAGRISADEVVGLGADDWRVFLQEVDAVTLDDARAAAARRLIHATVVISTPAPESVAINIAS